MDSDQIDAIEVDQQLLMIFQQTGALLEGHFQLTSGLHSHRYIQCALFVDRRTPK